MEVNSCVKSLLLGISQYCSNPSESSLSQLLRHLEVLLALLKANDVDQIFNSRNPLGCECLINLTMLICADDVDQHVMTKIFHLLYLIAQDNISCEFLINSVNIMSSLSTYAVKHIQAEDSCTMKQCLQLVEKVSYGRQVSEITSNLDKLVAYVLEKINKPGSDLSSICLGILCNLVSTNISIQAQVKGMMNSAHKKNLMIYLRRDSNSDKISSLSLITHCCWGETLASKFYSLKNVTQTLKLLFAALSNIDEKMTLNRSADLCMEVFKHEEIIQQFIVFEQKNNCAYKLLMMLSCDVPTESACKMLELLVALCRVSFLRKSISERILKKQQPLEVLLNLASIQMSKRQSRLSLLAMDLIEELCEEVVDQSFDPDESNWHESVLMTICQQLTPAISDDTPHVSDFLINSATLKILKSLKILACLCNDEDILNFIVMKLNSVSVSEVIEHQLTHNLIGLSQSSQPEWSETGVEVVLFALDLSLKLKHLVPELEKQLYSTLQDTRIVPFLASAIASSDRIKIQMALRLHQEALPLPDFPAILLSDRIAYNNDKNSHKLGADVFQQSQMKSTDTQKKHLQPSFISNTKTEKISKLSFPSTSISTDEGNKENIHELIAKIQGPEGDATETGMNGKTSEIVEIYEHKISSLVTKENHLQDLLEAKTLALAQADRLISQYRCQRSRCEEDSRKMADMLKQSESKCEEMLDKMRAAECDRSSMSRELETVETENRNLQNIADHYDRLQSAFEDKKHKIDVLERNLKTSQQEYVTLKELHEMIQKHNEKLKQQYTQATSRLEDVEEERLTLLKRIVELESSVSDLTQLVEEQDKSYNQLAQKQSERDVTIKNLKLHLSKRDEDIKELKIKVSSQEHNKQQMEHQVKERNAEIKKLNSKMDAIIKKADMIENEKKQLQAELAESNDCRLNLQQKLDKQAQTLLMITELSNNIRGSQC
uniref:Protein CIP2A homolog n=1 Tax=Phallusia mammillata TaxID=59560 RepID=A0A6F9D8T5_9ASCI|nr:protein CIP2A homolog [Phallusia mammillata]